MAISPLPAIITKFLLDLAIENNSFNKAFLTTSMMSRRGFSSDRWLTDCFKISEKMSAELLSLSS